MSCESIQLRMAGGRLRVLASVPALMLVLLTVTANQITQAQTYTVLHSFTNATDGANPTAGVTIDRAGNLYGTTSHGGIGHGTVYKLQRKGSSWALNPIYSFAGGAEGASPTARVILGPDSLLYGTTTYGGSQNAGTVFRLAPSPKACSRAICPWTETLLYVFSGAADGANPGYGDLVFDQAGNLYGTTYSGGESSEGIVFELMASNGMWTENSIYSFSGSNGSGPLNGVIFDSAGNLYGTTYQGGRYGYGTIFQLSPSMGWTESVLHSFGYQNDGAYPRAGLIPDQSGNLYGATSDFAPGGGGLVFKLSPSGDSWTYLNVYNLTGTAFNRCGPWGDLAVDAAGNLYGTTFCDGPNKLGSVFKLTFSGGLWIYTSLHDFTGGNDGANPISNVVIDASGNLYGTASAGGALGYGVVWEITP